MRTRIGLFDETYICRGRQPPEELNLRTPIDERFSPKRVSENLEEIGNLQRMLCEELRGLLDKTILSNGQAQPRMQSRPPPRTKGDSPSGLQGKRKTEPADRFFHFKI